VKISALIATYNRRDALEQCLRTLLDQDLGADQYEIVVVVDGSSDRTTEMLHSLKSPGNLVVIEQSNRGKSAALNVAVGASSGEIILIIDDDFLCDRALLSTHLASHEPESRRLVFGRIRSALQPAPSLAERAIHDGLECYYDRLDSNPQIEWPEDAWAGPNCSMSRKAFILAGGTDEENFPRRAEDSDLGLRLWKFGIQFKYEPRAIATHRWVKANRQYWADCIEDGASLFRLSRKHPETRPYWGFAGLASAPAWKLRAAKLACSSTVISRIALGVLAALSERLAAMKLSLGAKLFRVCTNLAGLVGARREAGSWRALVDQYGKRLPVLLYHHIGARTPRTRSSALTVNSASFKRQVRWLRWRGYVGITPAQWLAWRSTGEPLPAKPVLITFDDAFADIVQHAFPVLKQYGHRAAVFVISGLMRSGEVREGLPVMTQDQILDWSTRGIEFGAHTRTHPNLTTESEDRIEREVKGSQEDLEAAGIHPISFAYPLGAFNEQVRRAVDQAFSIAFTCEEGTNDLRTDPLLMKRIMVLPSDSLLDLEFRLALGWSPFYALRHRLRIGSRISRVWQALVPRS
jgi:peptidoglycan/xylan/chitin deacetylase (PgdA/CDA1 family)/GT2 family glycosyltransferase